MSFATSCYWSRGLLQQTVVTRLTVSPSPGVGLDPPPGRKEPTGLHFLSGRLPHPPFPPLPPWPPGQFGVGVFEPSALPPFPYAFFSFRVSSPFVAFLPLFFFFGSASRCTGSAL